MDFELVSEEDAEKIMYEIGTCKPGICLMLPKTKFRLLKVKRVRNAVANILKQEMLSAGGDVAVSEGTVNCKKPQTDVLVMGTEKQYQNLVQKMRVQGGTVKGCVEIAETIERAIFG